MLTFSTVFPVDDKATVSDVDDLARKWLAGSPHNRIGKSLEDRSQTERGWIAESKGEKATALFVTEPSAKSYGLHYDKAEDRDVRWITEVVFRKTSANSKISVKVFCESVITALTLPPARKPYLVRQIISELGGGLDGSFIVRDCPIVINNSDIDLAADIINSVIGNSLPIVYISATHSGEQYVAPDQLAKWLSGIAHVAVEPNREFSFRLMHEVGHRNAYGGAVGIYWPDRSARELLVPAKFDFDSRTISAEIAGLVRNRAVRLRTPRAMTWAYLKEIDARSQIAQLRESGSRDLERYIENFDAELTAKDEGLAKAEEDNRRLEAELYAIRAKSKTIEGMPILVRGNEGDFYEDECLEVLLDVLSAAVKNTQAGTRRRHLLEALISANPIQGRREELVGYVKRLLSQYRKLNDSLRHELEELGFAISSDGKHHKLTFGGDNRYVISMPKTSSDHRSGKNIVSQIVREIF